jgi:phosphate:Na+ symporter
MSPEDDRVRGTGRILIGLGLMLLGLTLIGQDAGEVRDSRAVHAVLASLGTEQLPLLAVLVTTLITWLAHSSLATVLLVMSLAGGGMIGQPAGR